jgi:WhiB family transcriptional regulator, redox-sensing transcriptional regulator
MSEAAEAISRFHRAGSAGNWRHLALCSGHPERGCWFPDDDGDPVKAVAICRVCPVRAECLDFAITTGQSEGVWGGATPSQRRRMARELRRAQ